MFKYPEEYDVYDGAREHALRKNFTDGLIQFKGKDPETQQKER